MSFVPFVFFFLFQAFWSFALFSCKTTYTFDGAASIPRVALSAGRGTRMGGVGPTKAATSLYPVFIATAMASTLKAALVAVLALAVAGAHAQCSGYTSCDSCAGSGECKDRWNREGGNQGRVLEWTRVGTRGRGRTRAGAERAREARDTRETRVLACWGNDRPLNGRMCDGANELEERRRFCARFLDSERDEDKVGVELFPLCPPRSLAPPSLPPFSFSFFATPFSHTLPIP